MNDQRKLPLDGIRIFDLTAWMVGPWASRYLGALGADVLHVERPGTPLPKLGRVPPMIKDTSIGYLAWNLNKRGLALDLKEAWSPGLRPGPGPGMRRVHDQHAPGVAERLGLGYADLAAENDGLVYCSITGWGTTGPIASKQGADTHLQAYSGFWSVNGPEGGRPEYYRHYTQLDAATGNYATQAILFARWPAEDGRGSASTYHAERGVGRPEPRPGHGDDPRRGPGAAGKRQPVDRPDEVYQCQDHRYLGLSVTTDAQWRSLCDALRRPDLAGRGDLAGRVAVSSAGPSCAS